MSRQTMSVVAVAVFALVLSSCTTKQESPISTPIGDEMPAQIESINQELPSSASGTSELSEAMRRVSAAGNYQSPAQAEQVDFELVVDADGVITEATSSVKSDNPISQTRQTAFAEAFPDAVVGKKLSELENVDRIGGSSLTTGAFNAALAELKSQL